MKNIFKNKPILNWNGFNFKKGKVLVQLNEEPLSSTYLFHVWNQYLQPAKQYCFAVLSAISNKETGVFLLNCFGVFPHHILRDGKIVA